MSAPTLAKRSDSDRRWESLIQRDMAPEEKFVYAVRTTGIYCRPGCPSRLPRRTNTLFFQTSAEAERAGFRPCKKCGPRTATKQSLPVAVARACQLIDESSEPLTLRELASAVGVSRFHLQRQFRHCVGLSPKEYASARRAERLRAGLRNNGTVTEALYDAGFGSSSRCYESAAANLGMTPAQYKNGGIGQTIRFASARCSLGRLLVGSTARGICFVALGDSDARLKNELASRFPQAELLASDTKLREHVQQIVALLESPGAACTLPIDLQGTAFQRRVWQALQSIPCGQTVSYGELARRVGQPSAVRAVAQACGANPVAIVVPCHRVVRTSGDLGGYHWGVERKRQLLEREAKHRSVK